MTPSGIEPATFQFVAQHLNHCATAIPVIARGLIFLQAKKFHLFLNRLKPLCKCFCARFIGKKFFMCYIMGRPRCRWVDNIRIDLQEVGCRYMDWIELAQDRDRSRTLVSAVMNLRVP